MRQTLVLGAVTLGVVLGGAVFAGKAAGFRFYPDDPIWHDPETQNAAGVKPRDLSQQFDAVENSFLGAGEKVDKRAVNVNTIDEVPDSTWFTNRIGRRPFTAQELAKGPDTGTGPAPGQWTIISGKMEGIQPGFTIRDSAGQIYFIKFDPPSNPEMATGAEVIATKFFHAAGYHVPENYLANVKPDALLIDPSAEVVEDGKRRQMKPWDLDEVLATAAQSPDGSYRTLASKALEGQPVGPFRYYGTRPDDPNDIFPHEHRRELRGLLVLAAWLNHDDSRAINTLDTLVRDGGRSVVRHHLIDFGSTFGSGSTRSQSPRAGNEFVWESRPTVITMLTLGFYVRPWIKVQYPDIRAIGRFEGSYFRPEAWKPEYANTAFTNARPEDLFWAARIVAAFTEQEIRAIVRTAKYSDPRATDYMVETLVTRRNKVVSAWLNGTNPIVDVALDANGALTFENAAEAAGVGPAAERYTVEWSGFDNTADAHVDKTAEQTVTARRAQAPAGLLSSRHDFVAVTLRAHHPERPSWAQPLTSYFRRQAGGWALVGLERNP